MPPSRRKAASPLKHEECVNCHEWFSRVARHWATVGSRCYGFRPPRQTWKPADADAGIVEDATMHDGSPWLDIQASWEMSRTINRREDEEDIFVSAAQDIRDALPTFFEVIDLTSALVYGTGPTPRMLQLKGEMDSSNPYHPFASKSEWKMAAWLIHSKLPRRIINDYFHQPYVRSFLKMMMPHLLIFSL
jgi:hypothetical protein